MKTILYQPLFINPQAYFVFPSLYHIEKGDSYVEPAVYTGQLLIDVVDDSVPSTIIKDTKQVDFSDYAGKHIRISQYTEYGTKSNSINVQVKGFSDKVLYLRLGYLDNGTQKEISVFKDGIYTIPGSESETSGAASRISILLKEDSKVTVTQIPDYPNQLCYNGSSYGVAYGLPILNDYTIIADRTWFDKSNPTNFITKGSDSKISFLLEEVSNNGELCKAQSFGSYSTISLETGDITYQTKNKYNNNDIVSGNSADDDVFIVGGRYSKTSNSMSTYKFAGCHGDILLFNRTLTDDEITWLKETIINNN